MRGKWTHANLGWELRKGNALWLWGPGTSVLVKFDGLTFKAKEDTGTIATNGSRLMRLLSREARLYGNPSNPMGGGWVRSILGPLPEGVVFGTLFFLDLLVHPKSITVRHSFFFIIPASSIQFFCALSANSRKHLHCVSCDISGEFFLIFAGLPVGGYVFCF